MDPDPAGTRDLRGRTALAPGFRVAGVTDLAPAGTAAKAAANLEALATLRALAAEWRLATVAEQAVLARWSGWGAVPGVFDDGDRRWADTRHHLRQLLDDNGWRAAERTTLNAHYTPADLARLVWDTTTRLGFTGGTVLEPGCGAGTFLGTVPSGLAVRFVGVELDPTTAGIAQALYPQATIRNESFADSRFEPGSFDLVIGNVPFGKVALYDPVHNRTGQSIHNHFLIKSVALLRPSGVLACFTSRFTLDARNPAARRQLAEQADLIGAVRFPAGTMRAVAGTDVVVDLLLLRRRDPGAAPRGVDWEHTATVDTDDGPVTVNEVFVHRPHWVLGQLSAANGQYGAHDLTVIPAPGQPITDSAASVLDGIIEHARTLGLHDSGRGVPPAPEPPVAVTAMRSWHKEGSLLATDGGGFARITNGTPIRFEPSPRRDHHELRAVIAIRDALFELLDAESSSFDDTALDAGRRRLNQSYDTYRTRYGPINRFRLARTGRRNPTTGEDLYRRVTPRMGGFWRDPDLPVVLALEDFDPVAGTATKAAVFTGRVVAPRQPRLGADTAEDALAICLDEHGRPDLAVIAGLLGTDSDTRTQLDGLVFDDPATGLLVTTADYLAGDVRAKLAAARTAAESDPSWQPNVEALEAVQPPDLEPADIDARPGAPWIPASDVAAFAHETFGVADVLVEQVPLTATWTIVAPTWARRTVATTSEWGTQRVDAVHLLEAACNQRTITVYDETDDGRRVVNVAETLAAREKQEQINNRFATWVWDDAARAQRLGGIYNDRFNNLVLPRYDGAHLSLPGLSQAFRPHPHQRDAVWRILSQPTTLLAHAVGAGKTATMVMAGMELRRLGLVTKPAYVVPNHMLEQFSRELLQLYPQARVLIATKDQAGAAHRKAFVARCATGDWDAVVICASTFERIPVAPDTQRRFLEDRIDRYRAAIEASRSGAGLSVKKLQAALAREEERHRALLARHRKDDGVTFEATGIDYLFCDEAHAFKNLHFPTRIQGVGGNGSRRAEDLAMKLDVLRGRHGERVATLATATPIANSLAEMYVMQTFLQPAALEAAGIASFDAWAATFGRTVTALELAPDGGSYRMHTRFARFGNVPELLRMFRAVADVRTPQQLNLPVPALTGGQPETVVVPPSGELRDYVSELVERANQVRNRTVRPDEDNMLKISGDGRRAALHLALVDRPADPDHGKLAAAADRIAGIYHATATSQYPTPDGGPSPRAGALQLVFCDLGVPKTDHAWSVYQQLRDLLAERGVPVDGVRFMHEAGNDKAKAELFAACRDGRVNVLVGSTERMGVGTNVQARAVALHHLDCPWRPADIEQREGRLLRQGNLNPSVEVVRYVTEGSFDIYMWQTCERKAAMIHQIMRGDTGRAIDDVGDQALSYAEVKALATGNPLIMEQAGLEAELSKLVRLQAAHRSDQTRLGRTRDHALRRARHHHALADAYRHAITQRVDTRGDRFTMTINNQAHTSRPEAGAALRRHLSDLAHGQGTDRAVTPIGELGGLAVAVEITADTLDLYLQGVPIPLTIPHGELATIPPGGLVSRLEHRLHSVDERLADSEQQAQHAEFEADQANRRLGTPFPHHDRIDHIRQRLDQIDAILTPAAELEPQAPNVSSATPARTAVSQGISL